MAEDGSWSLRFCRWELQWVPASQYVAEHSMCRGCAKVFRGWIPYEDWE